MAIALLTNYLVDYRRPLYELLAERHGVEVLGFGGGERYVPSWFADLDGQIAQASFPARRVRGLADVFAAGRDYEALIAPHAGGAMLPAAYTGARRHRRPFILWASVWAQPRSPASTLAAPLIRRIYRHADAVVAYGEHTRRFVASIRGRDDDVFVAPQSVERELFEREIGAREIADWRARQRLPPGPLVLYVGRLVPEKGVEVLLDGWRRRPPEATLVLIGEGPLAGRARDTAGTVVVAPQPRDELVLAYAAAELAVLASVPTKRFLEPWGLVCNEAMLAGRPVVASTAVGAVAGGLVTDHETGLVVTPGDDEALIGAIEQLLSDPQLRAELGARAKLAASRYTYEAMLAGFERAFAVALPGH